MPADSLRPRPTAVSR